MPRLALLLVPVLPVLVASPLSASAAPRAEGRIESEEGRIEILASPVRVGERIDLPEGFLRVEEEGTEDERIGSFGVISSETALATAPVWAAPGDADDPAPAADTLPPCRAERTAYLAELMKQSGIEVSDPVALLEGLEAGATGPKTGYYWFALATDAFRPLAWNSELRDRADALMRCVRGG